MTVIDLSEQIDDIRSRYPEYWRSDEAQRELQALWGGADCNDCGVFERDETVRIDLDGTHWYGEVRIAVAPNGWHAMIDKLLVRPRRRRIIAFSLEPPRLHRRATKPSPPASTNSLPNSRACATAKATHRKTSLPSHNA